MTNRVFIIGYDVTNPQRLNRVYREMCKFAIPLEYSVFLLSGTLSEKTRCLAQISELIEPKVDDVRCYTIPRRGFQNRIGCSGLPEGIHWTGLPAPLG